MSEHISIGSRRKTLNLKKIGQKLIPPTMMHQFIFRRYVWKFPDFIFVPWSFWSLDGDRERVIYFEREDCSYDQQYYLSFKQNYLCVHNEWIKEKADHYQRWHIQIRRRYCNRGSTSLGVGGLLDTMSMDIPRVLERVWVWVSWVLAN